MNIERESRRSHAVNLTPLIDVVFLLIVFFMLSTSFTVSESMELSIPPGGAKAALANEIWVLRVKADGSILRDDERIDLGRFRREVRERLKTNPEQKMLVLAAKDTTVQQLVSVLDVIYLAGGRQVQIDRELAPIENPVLSEES